MVIVTLLTVARMAFTLARLRNRLDTSCTSSRTSVLSSSRACVSGKTSFRASRVSGMRGSQMRSSAAPQFCLRRLPLYPLRPPRCLPRPRRLVVFPLTRLWRRHLLSLCRLRARPIRLVSSMLTMLQVRRRRLRSASQEGPLIVVALAISILILIVLPLLRPVRRWVSTAG